MKVALKDIDKFNKLLIENGYSKKSFAAAANLGNVTVLNVSSGKRHPSARTAKKIIDTLGVGFDDVFEIKEV